MRKLKLHGYLWLGLGRGIQIELDRVTIELVIGTRQLQVFTCLVFASHTVNCIMNSSSLLTSFKCNNIVLSKYGKFLNDKRRLNYLSKINTFEYQIHANGFLKHFCKISLIFFKLYTRPGAQMPLMLLEEFGGRSLHNQWELFVANARNSPKLLLCDSSLLILILVTTAKF